MTDIAIRVENLSKLYRIGQREPYKTLRDVLTKAFSTPFRLLRPTTNTQNPIPNYIWALKDVSFEVKQGEVVGIIGRNGQGRPRS
jgi:lipopolysaccharide transport system ATP-binding protein